MAPGGGVGNNINNNIGTDTTADRGSRSFLWSIHFYAQYFDVDTNEVLKRCWAAIYPRTNFLDVLDGNPDLYGPFWIATTVVMILFLTGTISRYIALSGGGQRVQYDFTLLSGAAGLIYGYTGMSMVLDSSLAIVVVVSVSFQLLTWHALPSRNHPDRPVGGAEVVREPVGELDGMLVALRIRQLDLDSRRTDFVVADQQYVSLVQQSRTVWTLTNRPVLLQY